MGLPFVALQPLSETNTPIVHRSLSNAARCPGLHGRWHLNRTVIHTLCQSVCRVSEHKYGMMHLKECIQRPLLLRLMSNRVRPDGARGGGLVNPPSQYLSPVPLQTVVQMQGYNCNQGSIGCCTWPALMRSLGPGTPSRACDVAKDRRLSGCSAWPNPRHNLACSGNSSM